MKTQNETGTNRTGIQTSPLDSRATERGAAESAPTSLGGELPMARLRLELARASDAIGSMPPPATVKGVAKTAMNLLKGERPAVLLNKLGERLAFERTGVRLYEAIIDKLPAFVHGAGALGPTVAQLRSMQEDELCHLDLVRRAIDTLGGDPTAMTPAADVSAMASLGVLQVASDPRAQLAESLYALHVIELVDNDGWQGLIELAGALGQDEMAASFREAAEQEQLHLENVRAWVTAVTLAAAGVAAGPVTAPAL